MTFNSLPDDIPEIAACPNCGNLNPPSAQVCPACGMHIDRYAEAKNILEAQQQAERNQHRASLYEVARQAEIEERKHASKLFWRQWLPGVLLSALLLSIPVILFAAQAGLRERNQREAAAALRLLADNCLTALDFVCARDAYSQLVKLDPSEDNYRQNLWLAQVGMAKSLADNGQVKDALEALVPARNTAPEDETLIDLEVLLRIRQAGTLAEKGEWQTALDSLSLALELRPENADIHRQMIATYDNWIAYERAQGNIVHAALLEIEKKARFP